MLPTFNEWVKFRENFDREEARRVRSKYGPWMGGYQQAASYFPGKRNHTWYAYNELPQYDIIKRSVVLSLPKGGKLIDFEDSGDIVQRLIKLPDGTFKIQQISDPDELNMYMADVPTFAELQASVHWEDVPEGAEVLDPTWQNAVNQTTLNFPKEISQFIDSLEQNPSDEMTYLVMADWLEERGYEKESDFLRNYISQMNASSAKDADPDKKEKQLRSLLLNFKRYIKYANI